MQGFVYRSRYQYCHLRLQNLGIKTKQRGFVGSSVEAGAEVGGSWNGHLIGPIRACLNRWSPGRGTPLLIFQVGFEWEGGREGRGTPLLIFQVGFEWEGGRPRGTPLLIFQVGFEWEGGRPRGPPPLLIFQLGFEWEGGREGGPGDPHIHFPNVLHWFLRGREARETSLPIFHVFYTGIEPQTSF